MKKAILAICWVSFAVFANGQTLPAARSTNWVDAGLRDTSLHNNFLIFSGVGDGATDHASAFQTILDAISTPTIIQFEAGNFLFNEEIALPSNVIIRGKGAGITTFTFDFLGANKDCFQAQGGESGNFPLTAAAAKGDQTLHVNNANVAVGDYIRMIQDDEHLLNDSWAHNRTGQVVQVTAVSPTQVSIASPLRMDFPDSLNPYFRKVNAIKNTGLECFTLVRNDQVTDPNLRNKSSNIRYNRTVNCWVKGVESDHCNYAHFEALYSANLLVSDCYFHDAFEHGGGGRAYGAMLHFATSETRVENSIFSGLRHSMILQAGANGNVFAYNFSTNTNKGGANGEDMVCHGNYAYLNLFEGNVAEWASVDGSHGENGPYNTYFRNRATGTGFNVTSYNFFGLKVENSNQNFLGNEGSQTISGSDHQKTLNSWQGGSGTLETSLAYNAKPDFLSPAEFGAIGYPNFGTNASNPATSRYAQNSFIDVVCGTHHWDGTQWENSFAPDDYSENFDLQIAEGSVCTLNNNVTAHRATIAPNGRLYVDLANSFSVKDTVLFQAAPGKYAQLLANAAVPAIYEMVIENAGWHYLASPLSGVNFEQLENAFQVNYQGNTFGPSVFYWDPNAAEYVPIVDGTASFSGGAFNIFLSDFLVPNGGGINSDGNLPVKLILKGNTNNGAQQNSPLGFGTASDFTGTADGWNLLFNPYPSAIDLDEVFDAPPASFEVGAHIFNAATQNFEVRSTTAQALGTASSIAPGQSFFVRLNSSNDTSSPFFDFSNDVRTVSAQPNHLKSELPHVRLRIVSSQEIQTLQLNFSAESSENYTPNFDISTMLNQAQNSVAFIKPNQKGKSLLGVASMPSQDLWEVPVAINRMGADYLKWQIDEKTAKTEVYLLDRYRQKVYHLNPSKAVWTEEGSWPDRFVLLSKKEDPENQNEPNVFFTEGGLFVDVNSEKNVEATIAVFNVSGQLIFQSETFKAKTPRIIHTLTSIPHGSYLIRIHMDNEVRHVKLVK